MKHMRSALSCMVVLLARMLFAQAQETEWKLANGLEVMHIQKPSSKVLASIVTISVGAKDETAETNGLSHLLEHMVFDGTTRRTRADINEGSKRYGGYVNATTRTSYTCYISAFPADYAELSLDLQADMLFNSTIPETELTKERKVVIEEMKRDRDMAAGQASEYLDQMLFAGTPFARPVLGSENIIATVPRATVLEYYRRYYVPSRMRALIISPFPENDVHKWVDKTFGAAPARNTASLPAPSWTLPKSTAISYREGSVPSASLLIAFAAPALGDPDYLAYDLLTRYLAEGGESALQRAIRQGKPSLAENFSSSLEVELPFAVWKLSATTQPAQVPDVVEAVRRTLQNAALTGIPEEDLMRLQRQIYSQEAMLAEQPHFFGMMKAPFISTQGFRFTSDYPLRMRTVTAGDVRRVADKYFSKPAFFAGAVVPKGKMPSSESPAEAHAWRKEVLPNGLTLVAQGSDESEVFAMCVFTRQRSALEPANAEGISDWVQRMLLRGTANRSSDEIQKTLDRISAQIQYVDNPFIPYDDHYTSNRFTFFRLEVLDEMRRPALDLISEIYSQATFAEAELEKVRQEILRLQMRDADNSAKRAAQRLSEVLLANTPYNRTILGKPEITAKFSRTQLLDHYKRLMAPSNLVVLAVGKGTTGGVLRDLKTRFEPFQGSAGSTTLGTPAPRTVFLAEQIPAEKQQTQITAGTLTTGWDAPEAAAMRILNSILAERLAVELRETQGLAYSVASDLQQEQGYGWIAMRMGTRNESAEQARKGVLSVIARLASGDISAAEQERAVNGIWGSTLRTRLPRIGQVFYRGIDEVRYSGYDAEERLITALRAVTLQDLQRLAKEVMNIDRWALISVGK